MVETIRLTHDNFQETLERAKEVVMGEGILIYPTDTVYGIGGDALSLKVVERINRIKGISAPKPMSVIMSDMRMIEEFCEVGLQEEMVLNRYLPGPFTFVLRLHRPMPVTDNLKLGVRIPQTPFCHELAAICGRPIVTTSANITGKPPPSSFAEISKEVLQSVDLAIDEGITRYRRPSEVVDLVDGKVIRAGGKEILLSQLPER